jgi:hypothetical protein
MTTTVKPDIRRYLIDKNFVKLWTLQDDEKAATVECWSRSDNAFLVMYKGDDWFVCAPVGSADDFASIDAWLGV